MEGIIVLVVLMVIVLAVLANCVKIVPQARAMVIERLGGYLTTWSVGIHFKVPFLDRLKSLILNSALFNTTYSVLTNTCHTCLAGSLSCVNL